MMSLISDAQMTFMRNAYNASLPDLCILAIRSNTTAADGQEVPSWDTTTYVDIPCGFETSPFKFRAREIVAGGESNAEMLVRARLPLAYADVINQDDRMILTDRYGSELATPMVFDVQGPLERGPVGLVVNLKFTAP